MRHQVLPQRPPEVPWIQVAGSIVIHQPGHAPHRPEGSTRILLAVLIAVGSDGATMDELGATYWNSDRPSSWRMALRRSIDHLQNLLPAGWSVELDGDTISLAAGEGWVDAWRLEQLGLQTARPSWLAGGELFAPLQGIDILDRAKLRLDALVPSDHSHARAAVGTAANTIRDSKRLVVVSSAARQRKLINELAQDDVETHMIVGDSAVSLPFAPYAMAFPLLREFLQTHSVAATEESTIQAWQLVAQSLAEHPIGSSQRLVIANAHELDAASRLLTTLLIERGPLNDTSFIIFARGGTSDPEWLSFVNRSLTAGCEILDLTMP